jgi:predicted unusual protein kinase regulating ubiquinone biosynthesis (AarF/ABC1/UbiB family)
MSAGRRVAAVAAGGVGIGVLVAAGRKLSRVASWRSRRMWKMTARGATRYAGTKARRIVTPAERRAALDQQFAIRTAEDVAKELGEMKGVLMKVGQLVSFIVEALPDEAQAALASLQKWYGRSSATSRSGSSAAGRICRSPRRASARFTGR